MQPPFHVPDGPISLEAEGELDILLVVARTIKDWTNHLWCLTQASRSTSGHGTSRRMNAQIGSDVDYFLNQSELVQRL